MFCSIESLQIMKNISDFGNLKNIILFEDMIQESDAQDFLVNDIKLQTFSNIISEGERNLKEYANIEPDHVFAFTYTSGTLGTPKGSMLTHKNILSNISALQDFYKIKV